jgi:hypothetical protein
MIIKIILIPLLNVFIFYYNKIQIILFYYILKSEYIIYFDLQNLLIH